MEKMTINSSQKPKAT